MGLREETWTSSTCITDAACCVLGARLQARAFPDTNLRNEGVKWRLNYTALRPTLEKSSKASWSVDCEGEEGAYMSLMLGSVQWRMVKLSFDIYLKKSKVYNCVISVPWQKVRLHEATLVW